MKTECNIDLYNSHGGSCGHIRVETTSDVLCCGDIYLSIQNYLNETLSCVDFALELTNEEAETLGKALIAGVAKRRKYIDRWSESMRQEYLEYKSIPKEEEENGKRKKTRTRSRSSKTI